MPKKFIFVNSIISIVIHVAAEPYAYSYIATCTLLHVAKITQAWLHRKRVTVD